MIYNNYKTKSIKDVPLKAKTISIMPEQNRPKIFCQSKAMIKVEEVGIVIKNDHESIKKVFILKDLNIRFTKTFQGMSRKYKAGIIKTKTWLFKDKNRFKYFKTTVIILLILANVFFLVSGILINKQGTVITAKEFKKELQREINTNKIANTPNKNKNTIKTYKIKKGDTLWDIARSEDTTVNEILNINPDLTEDIKEGQEIKLKD